ncbi:MAG: VWA domain-containing protein [Oscillospiraceae bacterium]|nr:VWA domain-containing protein [Oscillospiraceae bacterium]
MKKILVPVMIFILFSFTMSCDKKEKNTENSFRIISSFENKDLEYIFTDFAKQQKIDIKIDYDDTINIASNILNMKSANYDACFLTNSIWFSLVNNKSLIKYSKPTSITPVVFGIKKTKAEELDLISKDVYLKDIINIIKDNKLKFIIPSVTQTDSGASAYLSFLNSLSGNPEVLTMNNVKDENVKASMISLFSGVERTSGSTEYLSQMIQDDNYNALIDYESSIININKELIENGKDPLYMLYPKDGVALSDSPFAYIDNGDKKKEDVFNKLQSYLLSLEIQDKITSSGRRAGYGGLVDENYSNIFNSDYGIKRDEYLNAIKYPNIDIIKEALNVYQFEFKKPTFTVFCLDFSGSMLEYGYDDLMNAMKLVLDEQEASNYFIQFSDQDKVILIPFNNDVISFYSGSTSELLNDILNTTAGGGTNMYLALDKAIETVKNVDNDEYNVSIVLMTDGMSLEDDKSYVLNKYKNINKDIPIFSILFGDADRSQLEEIATLSKALVLDSKDDLINAFKTIRAYN